MDLFKITNQLAGMLLRGPSRGKATLGETFTEMAAAQENWSDFDTSTADGLDELVWLEPELTIQSYPLNQGDQNVVRGSWRFETCLAGGERRPDEQAHKNQGKPCC